MEENYFHAVVEAYKGLAERIREQTGYTTDGLELMKQSFERPSKVNSCRTRAECDDLFCEGS